MIRSSFQSSHTGSLRRAARFDARLPRPLLMLLVVDLLLLLPIPFLLPKVRQSQQSAAVKTITLPQLDPILGGVAKRDAPQPAARNLAEQPNIKPLLIDPVRFQDGGSTDANHVAALLAEYAPDLAQKQVAIGADMTQPLANIITGQALRWNINPLVLVALLRTQAVSDTITPTLNLMRGNQPDLNAEIVWTMLELRRGLLMPITNTFMLADGTSWHADAELDQANFALLRFLAMTHNHAEMTTLLADDPHSWLSLAQTMMGDPREPTRTHVDDTPFLQTPFNAAVRPVARFDHQFPIVQSDETMLGNDMTNDLGYDGHNGWDYELPTNTPITAAARGAVVFAGWVDSGCATPAGVVVLQHGNGYRTSYWHLARIDVGVGDALNAGTQLGIVGATGCAHGEHLHFGVQRLGRDVDPAGWCQSFADPWAEHQVGSISRWLWRDQINPCNPQASVSIGDDGDPATAVMRGTSWQIQSSGNFGSVHAVATDYPDQSMTWRPYTPFNGWYRVLVFIPNNVTNAGTISYRIDHADGETRVELDQATHAGSWASLGEFRFLAGQTATIMLNTSDQPRGLTMWADAVALQRNQNADAQSKK